MEHWIMNRLILLLGQVFKYTSREIEKQQPENKATPTTYYAIQTSLTCHVKGSNFMGNRHCRRFPDVTQFSYILVDQCTIHSTQDATDIIFWNSL